jgi:uncharacterized protein DUF4905
LNLKKIIRGNKLTKFLKFSQEGNIWRMFFTDSSLLAGETRDLLNKKVFFFALNYEDREIFFKNFEFEEQWWISICSVNNDTIFLSSFRKPDMPEYLGIIAVDISNGNTRWKKDDLSFFFADRENVYAYKQLFETKKYFKLSTGNGEILNEITGNDIEHIFLRRQKLENEKYADYLYPLIYKPEMENEESSVLASIASNSKLSGHIEYVDFANYLIYNFHENTSNEGLEKQVLKNSLEIYDREKKQVVFSEVLNKEVLSYVPDSFFLKHSYLFYVREKKELTSINLK